MSSRNIQRMRNSETFNKCIYTEKKIQIQNIKPGKRPLSVRYEPPSTMLRIPNISESGPDAQRCKVLLPRLANVRSRRKSHSNSPI